MDIVEELRKNRENGAKRLVEEYRTRLLALARRFCHDPGDAEELVNRTFAAVVEGIDGFLEQSSFFTWMCQILVNLNSNDGRRKSRSMETFPGDVPEVEDDDARDCVYKALDAALLRDAIETLPKDIRKTLMMHYFMDLSVKDVARLLAIPVGTVKWRLLYARQILAAKLGAAAKKPGGRSVILALALCGIAAFGAGI
ncbi:MAG: RNA polymerase sigma factor, partial [Kiritimatiellae bacterium]|nr:RNA polymerase sigma factor [Kiritimatiellia bacterium]